MIIWDIPKCRTNNVDDRCPSPILRPSPGVFFGEPLLPRGCYQPWTFPLPLSATESSAQYRPLTCSISPTANRSGIFAPSSIAIVSNVSAGEQVLALTNRFGWLTCLRTQGRAHPTGAAAINQQVGIVAGQNSRSGIYGGLADAVGQCRPA